MTGVIMPRKLPPFVTREKTRHGRVVFYFRRGKGNRIRLPDLQSPEFKAAYDDALSGKASREKRIAAMPTKSLRWLVARFMESGAWAALATDTRKKHSRFYELAIAQSGNADYAGITRRTIQKSMDMRASTPWEANNFLKAMRALFRWAVIGDYVKADPTAGVKLFSGKTDGFKVWTREDGEKFCTYWPVGTKPRLAFELFLVTGLRRGDLHKLGPQHLKGDVLSIRAEKPPHHLITLQVPQFLLNTIAKTPIGDMAFMTKDGEMPFTSKESFGNWFSARCREAGIESGKSAHGIRKLSATIAADAGATTHELMAQYGWSNPHQAETYTRGADRQRLGIRSSARLGEQFEAIMPLTPGSSAGSSVKKTK